MTPRHWLWVGAGTLLSTLVAAAAVAKPMRMLAPSLFSMHCEAGVCVEQARDLSMAQQLLSSARAQISEETGQSLPNRRMILCKSKDCYAKFGGGEERAISYPYLGTLIAGPEWRDYVVRHELVHLLQFDRFGAYQTMALPIWAREGMAYALSGAPESDIPEHYQPYIAQYRAWQENRRMDEIWAKPPGKD